MKSKTMIRLACMACVAMLSVAMVAGCAAQETAPDEQTISRQYMAQVNQAMDELSSQLEGFEDAVIRDDVVSMRTKADNAFEAIETLKAIEAPEVLADVHEAYVSGCESLKEALSAYVSLYTEIESATDEAPFDFAAYEDRIAAIQDLYDEGIAQLESADAQASEL